MGQRANDFGRAWQSGRFNWDSLLGRGWQTAPAHWVSVWRDCSSDELVKASRQGLSAPRVSLRSLEAREEMALFDSFRPGIVVKQGLSRSKAIFASPHPDDVPYRPHRREPLLVEMLVDPREAYVGDLDCVTSLVSFSGGGTIGLDQFEGAFRKYWKSMVRLDHFLQDYERIELPDGGYWANRRLSSSRYPKTFFSPEVMVLTPVISQRHMRLQQDSDYRSSVGGGW